ncbi:glycoside hydrolase family 3 protein [Sodalis praecaptivus]|uniref:glycoside hydrolase family 3 protein n=1 Tax=Sodalis praecaptivus TaxID=1239307 RepID=UPI0027FFEF94|nr:glycoside hydrolase family 3 N-terminal domain-containing protein [Sodalis praecaptivus]CAJ0999494.1 Beta-hexosaminidase [Sodalis praecaptivus]
MMNTIFPTRVTGVAAVTAQTPRANALGQALTRADNSQSVLAGMTLREKIGQKIMLDFRYWGRDSASGAARDTVALNACIENILRDYHIGGVILFANNLKDADQIRRLTGQLAAVPQTHGIGLLIGTDNEGGNVFRLPRGDYTAFAGNMALGALYEGHGESALPYLQGKIMAQELCSLGLNLNFAPVVDVNSNQANPVINVRAFGDCPAQVDRLARQMVKGSAQIVTCYKHFPGHGDTHTDSHLNLPRVDRNREQAYAVDLAPYIAAIADNDAPDMIMTAHIQYPALDDSLITRLDGEDIIVPATLSRRIQHHMLRQEMGYRGVTITDALDMKAISDHFDPRDVVKRVFNAGVDIALMPVSVQAADEEDKLRELIDYIVAQVERGEIDSEEIDVSVARILTLKRAKNILAGQAASAAIGETERRLAKEVESAIADQSITLLQNHQLLPLRDVSRRVAIFTPWGEQGHAVRQVLQQKGFHDVSSHKIDEIAWQAQRQEIDRCDIVIVGSQAVGVSPVENNGQASGANGTGDTAHIAAIIDYAHRQQKKIVLLLMRSPYDIIHFDGKTDAIVATYAYYGLDNGVRRGESLFAAARALVGDLKPSGKLPVNIYNVDPQGTITDIRYPRGFGLNS